MRTVILLIAFAVRAVAQGAPVTIGVEGKTNQSATVAASGLFVAVAFGASDASGTDVFVAVSQDGGGKFAAPVRVNATAGDARVGGEQPPHVALIERTGAVPAIAVVWTAKGTDGTRLLTARSTDGGRTFGANTAIPGSDGAGSRGWESVAVDKAGHPFTLWLDHRETAKAKAMPAMGEMKHDPTAMAELSKLYFSSLDDKTPRVITGGVCYCCKTSLVAAADGSVYGVWRHVYAGSQRDIALTVSRDGGRTFSLPARVSEDHWAFDGCPDNGPTLAVDGKKRAHVVWPTPPDGKTESPLALFYAMSKDGRSFSPRVRVPSKGAAHHAQLITVADGSLLLAWDEIGAGGRKIHLARAKADDGGKPSFDELSAGNVGLGNYPQLAETAAGAVMAWSMTEGGRSLIGVVRVRR